MRYVSSPRKLSEEDILHHTIRLFDEEVLRHLHKNIYVVDGISISKYEDIDYTKFRRQCDSIKSFEDKLDFREKAYTFFLQTLCDHRMNGNVFLYKEDLGYLQKDKSYGPKKTAAEFPYWLAVELPRLGEIRFP